MAGRILVGTSSWADPGFVEEWYPEGMPARERLPWYAERFEAVELNSSFYAVPDPGTVRRWVEVTPDGFRFDVKLHRLLSRHSAPLDALPRDLRDGVRTTERGRVILDERLEASLARAMLEAVAPLEEAGRFGAFLLQLSPAFSPRAHELDELAPLLDLLSGRRVAIELRHKGWVEGDRLEEVLDWLAEHHAAWVSVDAPVAKAPTAMPPIDAVTRDDLAYLRLHGRDAEGYTRGRSVAERFGWSYSDDELCEIAERVHRLAEDAGEVHVMFNNNRGAGAPEAARRFKELLGQDPGPPAGATEGQLKLR
jgi:uncharacterized protein YecE (DUF72 family)